MPRSVPVPPTSNFPTTNASPPRWVEIINRPRPSGGDVVSTNATELSLWVEECVNLPPALKVKVEDDAGYSYSFASPTELSFKLTSPQFNAI